MTQSLAHSRRRYLAATSRRNWVLIVAFCLSASASVANGQTSTPPQVAAHTPPSHARVRQCAVEWRDKKKAGTDVGQTWREFAAECYVRK